MEIIKKEKKNYNLFRLVYRVWWFPVTREVGISLCCQIVQPKKEALRPNFPTKVEVLICAPIVSLWTTLLDCYLPSILGLWHNQKPISLSSTDTTCPKLLTISVGITTSCHYLTLSDILVKRRGCDLIRAKKSKEGNGWERYSKISTEQLFLKQTANKRV